ncbi:hypothetical protein [Fulvimarina manganoxydans]|uniref:hypothetical protein n=1 Tax=Fulvimarina manganoxydans TaxID=937218 RepID=UPI000A019BDB|nr:hypothetical protein [Fulvimarina manganoxydans]
MEKRESLELVWGGVAIAQIIQRSPRATFGMLEKGELPARKVNGRWVADRQQLISFFKETAA